ncbi:hypothetical protein CANCADRAFT_84553 [Tortispora caseinolytica NRRL Y-17796]|uniref:NAD(P)-binding domain-containing protein n=1 Tax=Tortispora caseinolytica NRRL Y-17796 TaxID=767744 RepID=A0A1E4TKM1_9ASCO|nr:hypothetical protein CANCADRAFT_84553 [Tortispora caseinolytica NRRL Y-17796]
MSSTITIIGGHGKIARILTPLLVKRGVQVHNVIRKSEQMSAIKALGGNPVLFDVENRSSEELQDAVRGSDALIFAAGAGGGSTKEAKHTIDYGCSVKAVDACKAVGIKRFVQISFIGVENEGNPEIEGEIFHAYRIAKRQADHYLRETNLDWTVVRPGALTDDKGDNSVILGYDLAGEKGSVKRANVALLIDAVLQNNNTIHKNIDVLDGPDPVEKALAELLK